VRLDVIGAARAAGDGKTIIASTSNPAWGVEWLWQAAEERGLN